LSEMIIEANPIEQVRDFVHIALGVSDGGRHKRQAMRVLRRVLILAGERGFRSSDFESAMYSDLPLSRRAVERMLHNLFEYVSADEVAQLARLG
jgi:hypothetical protein